MAKTPHTNVNNKQRALTTQSVHLKEDFTEEGVKSKQVKRCSTPRVIREMHKKQGCTDFHLFDR